MNAHDAATLHTSSQSHRTGGSRSACAAMLLVLACGCGGCLNRDGLFGAVSEDIALTASSATFGFLTGLFNQIL